LIKNGIIRDESASDIQGKKIYECIDPMVWVGRLKGKEWGNRNLQGGERRRRREDN